MDSRFMRRLVILFIFGFTTAGVYSQNLVVRDMITSRPIENVAIYNSEHTRTALTNVFGIADASAFKQSDTLIFQHASYQDYITFYEILAEHDFNVYLQKKSIALDEIVISATRFERKRDEIPNKVVSINPEKIKLENPQTAADMLAFSNEVFVQKSQLGGGSPMIRGFSANAVLIVVDGVRMNNAIFRSGNLQNVIAIDPNSLSRTEVILGPGTVIYGSDALGGVMSFMTLEPKLSVGGNFTTAVNLLARYSTANNERTGHLDFTLSGKKWASVTSFSASWFDDLRMGSDGPDEYLRRHYIETRGQNDYMVNNPEKELQRFSGYNQMNIMQKLRYKPVKWLDLTYGFHYSESSDVPRYDRLIEYDSDDTLKYANWYYGPQKWMMNVLNASVNVNCRMITEMKVSLAWQRFEESRHSRKFNNAWFKNQYEEIDMYTANIDIEKQLNSRNSFFYGFEGVYNDVVSTALLRNYINGETEKTGTRYPDGSNDYLTFAGYLNFEHRFSEPLTLFAGLRYNHVSLKSRFADTSLYHFPYNEVNLNTGALNGSLGLSWNPGNGWQSKVNASSGFRAPNLDDIGKVFDSSPGNVIVPNPGLKPEYAYSLDAAVLKEFYEIITIEFSAFYTYLIDAMVRRNFSFNGQDSIWYDGEYSNVEALVNAGSATIYGLSAQGSLKLGSHVKLSTAINWMKGEDDEGYSLRHVSPLYGNTTLSFVNRRFRAELYAAYNGSVPFSRLSPSERDKSHIYASDDSGNPWSPSWWTLNFKSTLKIVDQLNIDIGIENILNKRYRPYSSGIVAPGRNFIIALRANL